MIQYSSRAAREEASSSPQYRDLESRFSNLYSLGMKRNAAVNLAIPIALLGRRVLQIVRRETRRYPFTPLLFLSHWPPEAQARLWVFEEAIQANRRYGKEGMAFAECSGYSQSVLLTAGSGLAISSSTTHSPDSG